MSDKYLEASSQWFIQETTSLSSLTISEDASIKAPEGYSVTMTVDGVNKPIKTGKYEGKIILTVTENIFVKPYNFRTAIYVDNGRVVPEKSVSAFVVGGEVTGKSAKGISITSEEECVNGIYVTGESEYTIENPVIQMSGNGGNDFVGYGAAVMSTGHAKVTLENAKIVTHGAVRTAVFAGGDSEMTINNSYIEVNNGKLPDDYKFTVDPSRMKEVPWPLGLVGNCRATNTVGRSITHYNNTHIKAQAWGCLSTDAVQSCKLYAKNSIIETVESGYGAYSIGDCLDHFSGCTFKVKDMALIIAGEASGTFTDKCVVNSGRFGVMMHSGSGGGTLTIDKGSVFNTKSTAIQVKGRGTSIIVDEAELNPGNGIILIAMENDDPLMKMMPGPGGPGGPDGPGGPGAPGGPGGTDIDFDPAWIFGMPGGGDGPDLPPPGANTNYSGDVNATFKNVTLKGDIIHSMTEKGDMTVAFENTTITGAVTTAVSVPAGEIPTQKTYYLIGEVVNTFCASGNEHGIKVSLDGKSSWTVDKTSFLDSLTIAPGAAVTAPAGRKLTMTVDGVTTEIKAGTYTGKITLSV